MKQGIMAVALCGAQIALAAPAGPEFHRAAYALHEQQIARHAIRTDESGGEYEGVAARGYRYRITSYYDAASGRLLSRIQRDAQVPEAIHMIEVNVYDDDGTLVRDFFSSAPPWRPLHPTHTYINLHHHPGRLHSFRQFDLAGQVNYEFCEGELEGKPVRIAADGSASDQKIRASVEYRACFDGMPTDWARYTTPH